MTFRDKKVLITGGSRGIGRATAIAFSKANATVGLNYQNNDAAANDTLSRLEGQNHCILKYDISRGEEAENLINDFYSKYGTIDILINNAGISNFHSIDQIDYKTWQQSWNQIINTNLISVANLCFLASQIMIKNKSGRIINVSSRGGISR